MSNVKLHHMPLPKVYADVNAIEYCADEPAIATVALIGYGTLASLDTQGLPKPMWRQSHMKNGSSPGVEWAKCATK
jgi:hypothetical protein